MIYLLLAICAGFLLSLCWALAVALQDDFGPAVEPAVIPTAERFAELQDVILCYTPKEDAMRD